MAQQTDGLALLMASGAFARGDSLFMEVRHSLGEKLVYQGITSALNNNNPRFQKI